ncbi:MAG: hypothetical protein LC772_11645, partial [Chloroflexi bacterium]|nr:hypothetical protein [Chloroflexota bacterium]
MPSIAAADTGAADTLTTDTAATRTAAAWTFHRSALRLRQYGKTAVMEAAGLTGDSWLFLIDYLLRFLRMVLLLSLWRMILTGKGPVSGMTLGSVLTYTLTSELFAEAFTPRTDLEWTLRDGSIATRFLRPMGLFGQFSCQMLGRFGLSFLLFSLPLLLISRWLGVNPLPECFGNAGKLNHDLFRTNVASGSVCSGGAASG